MPFGWVMLEVVDDSEPTEQWHKSGLTQLGSGGKKNVGYGYFEDTNEEAKGANMVGAVPNNNIDINEAFISKLLNQLKECRQAGDKSKLVNIFEQAKAMPLNYQVDFLQQVKEMLPPEMKENKKVKPLLVDKEKELEGAG